MDSQHRLYESIGHGYARQRRPDPRIAAAIEAAIGDGLRVVNVGAGAGSYEPDAPRVVAVEPSPNMIAQRPPGAAPALCAVAESLPLRDDCADTALAILTIHHWSDVERGIAEMKRVATCRVVLVTWDPKAREFWLGEYFPDLVEIDRRIFPPIDALERWLEPMRVQPLPIPADCRDGFLGAYWRRPEAYLDADVRASISTFARLTDPRPGLQRLRADLGSGRWDAQHGGLRALDEYDVGYRIVVADL